MPAGWSGWGCTDNAAAFSYGFQLLSTLLLCLSNLMFVPPVAIAVRTGYLLEAAIYIFTMFFSTVRAAGMDPPPQRERWEGKGMKVAWSLASPGVEGSFDCPSVLFL